MKLDKKANSTSQRNTSSRKDKSSSSKSNSDESKKSERREFYIRLDRLMRKIEPP